MSEEQSVGQNGGPEPIPPPPGPAGSGSAPGTGGERPGPPQNIQQLVASKRLQQAQAQVGEVVDIMRVNVEKVLERDQKISELDRRADDLQEGASQFQQQAVKLKRKYWWENAKMWAVIALVLLIVVIVVVVTTQNQSNLVSVDVTGNDDGSSPEIAPIDQTGETSPPEPTQAAKSANTPPGHGVKA